jgi:hypothetical protein
MIRWLQPIVYMITDIDECDYVNCTEYATCYNTVGSFFCQCDAGFIGDGVNTCSGKHLYVVLMHTNYSVLPLCPTPDNSTSCSEECHGYAECYNNYCTCISGFTGNGTYCEGEYHKWHIMYIPVHTDLNTAFVVVVE